MIILKMTATFGKLDGETLELKDGLNVIEAPNEFGKSTWAAFLITMLYGIDTTQRTTKTSLPIKAKYLPWNGKPMAGSMEILWKNQKITIARTSKARTPMGEFKAFNTITGENINFLTAETCGETLLGVERSVLEKSGFIGQQALTIGADASLETRLTALVTTGDETVSYSVTRKKLVDLRNRRRHNKTGLLPQAEAQLQSIQSTLVQIQEIKEENFDLQQETIILQEKFVDLQKAMEQKNLATLHHKAKQLEQAGEMRKNKEEILKNLQESTANTPNPDQLDGLESAIHQFTAYQIPPADEPVMPVEPPCPKGFEGLNEQQATDQGKTHISQLLQLETPVSLPKNPSFLMIIIAIVLTAAVAVFSWKLLPIPLLLLAIAFILYIKASKSYHSAVNEQKIREIESKKILDFYQVTSRSQLEELVATYGEALMRHRYAMEDYQAKSEQFKAQNADYIREKSKIHNNILEFFPKATTVQEAKSAILQAREIHRQLDFATREAQSALTQFQAIQSMVGHLPDKLPSLDAQTFSPTLENDFHETREKLQYSNVKLAEQLGQLTALGDPVALQADEKACTQRIQWLQAEYDSLSLALEALDRANAQLQTRFSPQLNKVASEFFGILTNGKYDTIYVGQSMALQTRAADDIPTRTVLNLSGGTVDQLYLAVRLAITQLVLGEGVPLVLDDALAFFDDERAKLAIELLEKISNTNQIILFSCHNRENNWIS